jgi:hypothetical protein
MPRSPLVLALSLLLATTQLDAARRRAVRLPEGGYSLFVPGGSYVSDLFFADGSVWVRGEKTTLLTRGEAAVIDERPATTSVAVMTRDRGLCGSEGSSIRCVDATGVVRDYPLDPATDVSGLADSLNGDLWFTDRADDARWRVRRGRPAGHLRDAGRDGCRPGWIGVGRRASRLLRTRIVPAAPGLARRARAGLRVAARDRAHVRVTARRDWRWMRMGTCGSG